MWLPPVVPMYCFRFGQFNRALGTEPEIIRVNEGKFLIRQETSDGMSKSKSGGSQNTNPLDDRSSAGRNPHEQGRYKTAIVQLERRDHLLPLIVLRSVKKIQGKSRFQKIAFLAQSESDEKGYNFAEHGYGPHSDAFVQSISDSDLVAELICTYSDFTANYFEYSLTEKGNKILSELEKLDAGLIKSTGRNAAKYKDVPDEKLLEDVYSKFMSGSINDVFEELQPIKARITEIFKKFPTRESTLAGASLDIVENALGCMKNKSSIQKAVVSGISMEIIKKCNGIKDMLVPPIHAKSLEHVLVDLEEHERLLVRYCNVMKIMRDPYSRRLGDVVSEEDAKRLTRSLSKVRIPIS